MMNTVRRLALAATLILSASPALAQPGNYPPPGAEEMPPPPSEGTVVTVQPQPVPGQAQQPPVMAVVAPLNENWANVNHINGHPVKVGERGDYLHKWKKTNISTNPIGWMMGFYGLSLSHAVSPNIAIRGDANIYNIDNDNGYEFGLSLPIYFKRVYQGPFVEPGIMVRDFDTDDNYCDPYYDDSCGSDASIGPEVMFGWHWTFDSGMNVAIAFGAARALNKNSDYGADIEPQGYFRVGYAY
jgi:hypothetical protein